MLRRFSSSAVFPTVSKASARCLGSCLVTKKADANGHTIFGSVLPDVSAEIESHPSFIDLFISRASAHANDVAFVDGVSGNTLTYGDVLTDMERLAAVFYHTYGIRKGDVVALHSPNMLRYAAIFQAVGRLGAIVTTMNPIFTPDEVKKQLVLSKAKLLVTISMLSPANGAATAELRIPTLLVDKELPAADPVPATYDASPAPDDVVVLPFSSGTTGFPKGVQLTNKNLVANVYQTQAGINFEKGDVMMSVLPFFHIYGMVVLLHGIMNVGGKQVILPKFDMVQYMQLVEEHRASLLFVAPPIMVGFAKHPIVSKTNVDSVRLVFSGAAPLTQEVQKLSEPIFKNACICQGYGLTETSPVLTLCPQDRKTYGSAGMVASNTELRIVNVAKDATATDASTGEDAPPGEAGELWCRGPQVMKGYLREEDTRQVFPEEGWFRTGDLARIDPDTGLMYITERLKELIKYKGYQIAPAELEGVIQQHPDVQEVVVIGVEAEGGDGEVPCAHVALKPHVLEAAKASGNEQQAIEDVKTAVKAFVVEKTAPYKHLRGGIRVVEAVPKTASGKLLRRVARDTERQLAAEEKK